MKHSPVDPDFEQVVRNRLQQLGDLGPTEVRNLRNLSDVDLVPVVRRRPPPARIAAIGGALVALAGGITLTGIAATGGEDGGGNTPEDAVLEFVEAIENHDLLGALDVIDPGESEVLINTVTAMLQEAERVGLLSAQVDARDVPGATAAIEGLVLSTDQVATDVAVVTTEAGSAQLSFDLTSLPLGLEIADQIDPAGVGPFPTIDFASEPLRIATVERDGQWYVSFGYSIAEAARSEAGLPFPVNAAGPAEGFDNPGAAAAAFWERAASLDLAAAVATFAPGEADAVARYLPLWLPGMQESIADARASGLEINVSDLEFEITEDDTRSRVEPSSYVVEGTLPPASDPGFPVFEPDAATIVFAADGSGFYVIEAGDPIPESFDDLEPTTDFPVEFESGDVRTNSATLNVDGTFQPFWADEAPEGDSAPRDFRIEFADECTTTSGAIADDATIYSPVGPGVEDLGDGTYRTCAAETATSSLSLFGLLTFGRGGVLTPTMPSLEVVEIDGRWYVSPIGSIGVQVLDIFADVDDGQVMSLDSPLAVFIYGFDRTTLESQLVGRTAADIGPSCTSIVVVAPDGSVTKVSDDARLNDVRSCSQSESFWGGFSVDGGTEGEFIEVESAVPVPTTAPDN